MAKEPFQSRGLSERDLVLIRAYQATQTPVDALPYSDAITQIAKVANGMTESEVFRNLLRLRKSGVLPRMGRRVEVEVPREFQESHMRWLSDRVIELVGSLGRRDQLPYTEQFDGLLEEFRQAHPEARLISANELWLLVSRRAKYPTTPATETEADDEADEGGDFFGDDA